MGMLADWYVQLSTKGKEKVEKDIDDTGKQLEKAKQRAKSFEDGLKNAFTVAAAAITGFVHAGMGGTVEGEKLLASFKLLAEVLADLFAPAIIMIGNLIEGLAGWINKLSDEGQVAILALGAAIATAMAIATGGISAVITAIVMVLGLIGKLNEDKSKPQRNLTRFNTQGGGGFEDPANLFKRIQMAAVKAPTAEEQLKVMRGQLAEQKITNQKLGEMKKPTG